jgi:hypothetical protein
MKNQFCKVGSSKAFTHKSKAVIIEDLYETFKEKSITTSPLNNKRIEFFESKTQQFEKMLKVLH